MPWSDNSGKGGPTKGPWGQPPRPPGGGGGQNGGGRGQQEPPDLEELLKVSRQRLKRAFPRSGRGPGGGGGGQPLPKSTFLLAGAAVVGLWLFSGIYTVDADELGVVTTFGRYDSITTPGLHWHVPYPFQAARTERVLSVRPTSIPDAAESRRPAESGGLMLTGDKNIIDVAMQVQWQLKPDTAPAPGQTLPPVAQFLFNIDDPNRLVRTVGESAIREVVGRNELDFVQTEGRTVVQEQTRTLMQEALDLYGSGILIASVNLEKADPPTEDVNAAFLDVIAASQDRNTIINGARAYANRIVPEARGEAQRILEGARGYQAQVTADARGQASRFESILSEYQRAPQVTRQRMYLETVERVLGPMNKVIVEEKAGGGVVPYLPLNELPRRQPQAQTQQRGGGN